jgi:hypothetical protein
MTRLPPDLEQLGDALGVAVARSMRHRARQDRARRVVPMALAGALTCFAVAPAALEPAERRLDGATLVPRAAPWSELCAALPSGPAQLCAAFGSDRSDAAARDVTEGRSSRSRGG